MTTAVSTRLLRVMNGFEVVIITALEALIMITVAVGTAKLFVIFFDAIPSQIPQIDSAEALQPVLQDSYSGVLMVLLGLELMQTLKAYFRDHHLQMEVILVVAMIAVGRHIIQSDLAHMKGTDLLGLATLIASLAASYFLVKKTHVAIPLAAGPNRPANQPPDAN